ncbi:MAG: CDGSH iron-sulfur domain-containing protein [Bacteroidota bacterium]
MDQPHIAGKAPLPLELEAGKKYAWCACGLSTTQPLCDGAHRGTNFAPVIFTAEENKTAYLCTCKHSANPVFCDGTHQKV